MNAVVVRDARRIEHADARLVPASALLGLPRDPKGIARMLGVSKAQLEPMRGGALQAELDVPSGFWRVWPSHQIAVWIGRTPDAVMPFISEPFRRELDLSKGLLRLHRTGLWLQEATLVFEDGARTGPLPLETVVRALREHVDRIVGVIGFWGDESGRALQAELYRTGDAWVDNPTQAVRWLVTAYGLND